MPLKKAQSISRNRIRLVFETKGEDGPTLTCAAPCGTPSLRPLLSPDVANPLQKQRWFGREIVRVTVDYVELVSRGEEMEGGRYVPGVYETAWVIGIRGANGAVPVC